MSDVSHVPEPSAEKHPHRLHVMWTVLDDTNNEHTVTAASSRPFQLPSIAGEIEVTRPSGTHHLMRWHQTGQPQEALRTVDSEHGFGDAEIELLEALFAEFRKLLGRNLIRRLRLTLGDDHQHIDCTLLGTQVYDDNVDTSVVAVCEAFLKVYPDIDVRAQLILPYVPGPTRT